MKIYITFGQQDEWSKNFYFNTVCELILQYLSLLQVYYYS